MYTKKALLEKRAKLTAEKRTLLQKRLRGESDAPKSKTMTISRRSGNGAVPLSFLQKRLWFLFEWEPDSPAYNEAQVTRIKGSLDLAAFEAAYREIIQRHEILRTRYQVIDEQPMQVIAPSVDWVLPQVDLSGLSEERREAEAARLTQAEAQRPFDLQRDFPWRVLLVRLIEAEHLVFVTQHHISCDGWSITLRNQEFARLYEAFAAGRPSPLPALPIQYADFAQWQQMWLQGEAAQVQLAYWKAQLAGLTPLQLPTDRPHLSVLTLNGATEVAKLPLTVAEEIEKLGLSEGASGFMVSLAAFMALLGRYTGQTDLAVGSLIAYRDRPELEGLIGFLVETQVLRTDLSGNPTFRTLVRRVRQVALEAYTHKDLPFDYLVAAVQGGERDLSRMPLVPVLFIWQGWESLSTHQASYPEAGLEVEGRRTLTNTAQFDLTLTLEKEAERLVCYWEYNTDLFDRRTIIRMMGHFQRLIAGLLTNPDQRLSELPLLSAEESRQLLVGWNRTQVDYPADKCIHQLFEAQAAQRPDAVAVTFPAAGTGDENRQLTYRALDRRANQIAHYLRRLGVKPQVCLGICMERSFEMVLAVLGVLKVGGTYVPIDATYSLERLAFIVKDAQIPILLTQRQLADNLPDHSAQVICLDEVWAQIAEEPDERPVNESTRDNLAYIVYTSGTTGQPKGVMISHGSLVNAYLAWEDAYHLRAAPTCHLQMASFSFDVFSGDLVRALCSGGKLVLCPREILLIPERLYDLMCREGVNCAEFIPATFRNLSHYLEKRGESLEFMRLLIVGSDSWYLKEYEKTQGLCGPETRLINSYGLSEATIDSTYFEGRPGDWSTDELVPIGRPFANTQLYVLDMRLQPVPIGVLGELHVGGCGLAWGYLNRPGLTAEKFIPHPFSTAPGARLYKTGDLVRYLPDGNIQFLGRVDHQVKIRGFRVELGEIEAVLGQHPAVSETVILGREVGEDDQKLVAYLVVRHKPGPTAGELRSFVQEKLPTYMVPSAFVSLDALPLTPNGKVDRRALPAPDLARPELGEAFVAPRDTLELELIQIWERILNVRPVGLRDNFFALGGHSLLAIRLIAMIEKKLGKTLPLAALFQGGTVEHLADLLRRQIEVTSWTPLVEIQTGGAKHPLFFVHPVGGNILCYLDLARHLGPEQPFYGFQARGLAEKQAFHTQVEAMATYYIDTMRTVQPEGPYRLGGWSMGGVVAFEMAQQLRRQGQEIVLLALIDASAPKGGRRRAKQDDVALLLTFAQDLGLSLEDLLLPPKHHPSLELNEPLAYILERAKMANKIPSETEFTQIQYLFNIFQVNNQALQDYVPRPYRGQITLFKAGEIRPEDDRRPTLGWDALTTEGVEVHECPGTHFTMIREPHVQILAEQLRTSLMLSSFYQQEELAMGVTT